MPASGSMAAVKWKSQLMLCERSSISISRVGPTVEAFWQRFLKLWWYLRRQAPQRESLLNFKTAPLAETEICLSETSVGFADGLPLVSLRYATLRSGIVLVRLRWAWPGSLDDESTTGRGITRLRRHGIGLFSWRRTAARRCQVLVEALKDEVKGEGENAVIASGLLRWRFGDRSTLRRLSGPYGPEARPEKHLYRAPDSDLGDAPAQVATKPTTSLMWAAEASAFAASSSFVAPNPHSAAMDRIPFARAARMSSG